MNEVYILIDDYTPDAGSTIYGCYATQELAQKAKDYMESEDNEYGCNMNENDCMYIRSLNVQYK